jgi:DNA primase
VVRVSPRILDRRIKAAKDGVSILQVAQDLTTLRKIGESWRGECPLCHNGARSKAFSVSGELGVYYCHACGSGGDVVRLVESWGPFTLPEAVSWIGERYGVELPARPDSWYAKQDRQARLRRQIVEQRREVKRRRLFKYLILPEIEKLPNSDQARETEVAWEQMKQLSMAELDNYGTLRE